MRNSALGYSGSMGNAVRITDNHIYGNATGIASDTLSSAGHPGFPADSAQVDHNYIYANNFNVYARDSPVKPLVDGPDRHRDRLRGHERRAGARQLVLRQLALRRDAVRGARRADVLRRPRGRRLPRRLVHGRAGERRCRRPAATAYFNNRMGQVPPGFDVPGEARPATACRTAPAGEATLPQRQRLLVGRVPVEPLELLVRQHGPGRQAGSVTGAGQAGSLPGLAAAAAAGLRERHEPRT